MTSIERRPDSQGKVRDIYDAGDNLLMVASDRISAFDYILPDEIPFKGEVLNRISAFWFDKFADIVPNHVVSIDVKDFPAEFADYSDYLAGRAMLLTMLPLGFIFYALLRADLTTERDLLERKPAGH